RQRAAAGVQRSRLRRLGDRSTEVERIEAQTKEGLACGLHCSASSSFRSTCLQADGIKASANYFAPPPPGFSDKKCTKFFDASRWAAARSCRALRLRPASRAPGTPLRAASVARSAA